MIKKIKNNKVIVIIAVILLCIVLVIVMRPKVLQHKWTNQVIDALEERDEKELLTLLKDKSKDINSVGRSSGGKVTPLEAVCLQSYPAKYAKILIDNGAKVTQDDYHYAAYGFSVNSYEIFKELLSTGVKPQIIRRDDYFNTYLDDIAIAGWSLGYEAPMDENYYLKAFKLIYYNAEPFDKKPALKSALKSAKLAKNKPLIEFIESELAKLDNK